MKKKVKILLIVLIILLIIACIAVAGGYLYFKKKLNKITYKPLDETDLGIEQTQEEDIDENIDLGETTKFVIFGSDSRDEDDETKGRSDSIIIVCLNHVNKSITFISIPRDSYVNVPGYGMTKINHAYAYGQEQLSIKTINTNFGTDLSQYLTIDFSGMEKCIDRVGGVEVTLSQAEVNEINRRLGRGNNNVSMINHKLFNKLNNNQLNSTVNNNQNVPNVNQQKIINSPNTHNINYNIIPLQNSAIINRNNSSININPLQNKSISFSPNIYTPIQNYQNSPLILILPPSLSLSSQYNNQISNNNNPNIIYEKNINQSINYNINNNININSYNNSDSSFGNDSKNRN